MEKPGDHRNIPFTDETPETYMPRMQFFIRLLMGLLAGIYYYFIPIPPLILSVGQILFIVAGYYIFHLFWWWHYRHRGVGKFMISLGSCVDLAGAVLAFTLDPFIMPPMALMIVVAVLGNGIQHGLTIFVQSMLGGLVFGGGACVIRLYVLPHWPSYETHFYLLLIVVSIFYSYMLVRRIESMKQQAVEISEIDGLTGLLNRRAFVKAAEYLLYLHERTNISLVFVFADLDHFKAVNDEWGHTMGDQVLRRFSDLVRSRLRKTDITARYGGDEFVFIMTNTTVQSAECVTAQLRNEFTKWARNRGLRVGVSFGLGPVPEGKIELDEMLRRVDSALYEEKKRQNSVGT
ncbi:MAG: diguanylate cyclase [Deltaproteobacteria bacterium]|nr:diguanylate cyclase [Deltaproteobacteria bacterium]